MSDPVVVTRTLTNEPLDLALPEPLLRAYAARDISNPKQLDLGFAALIPPAQLPDIAKAAQRLVTAITQNEKILIVGDFDADGATSVALCVLVLQAFGAQQLSYLVPNRFEFGYGLSEAIVELAARQDPAVLVTVDNGVSSIGGVAAANALGIDVVITDHHLQGSELPAAYAIVNPNLNASEFPSKALAGVGVAYYLLSVLRAQLRESGWFEHRQQPNLADYLDLVALGTVADVVPLDHNNRILVEQGLRRIRAGRARPGLLALCEIGKRKPSELTAADLGFAVGPRLNAAGRLDDMSIGIRCLLSQDIGEARKLAQALDQLNKTRRQLQQDMQAEAEMIVAGRGNSADMAESAGFGVCVFDETWHQGVVGLVAGQLKEKLGRPVIAFAEAGVSAPGELKGSARSIPALHIRDVLDEIATRYPGLIEKFGGHAMAAGLSIRRVHLDQFTHAFDTAVRRHLKPQDLTRTLLVDGELQASQLTLELAQAIKHGGPWGQAFPEPQFAGTFALVSQRVVGVGHLRLTLDAGAGLVEAIAFNQAPINVEQHSRVSLVYRAQENTYSQNPTLQLMVEHLVALA